jgi:predicted MFS family arabinose efflux permease
MAAGLATTLPVLVALRAAAGVGAALCASSLIAAIADVVPQERRARGIALVNTTTNVFIGVVGVPLAGIIAEATSWRASLALVGLFALAAAFAIWFVFPTFGGSASGMRRLYSLVLGDRSAMLLLAVALVSGIAWVGWSTFVVVFFQHTFGVTVGVASTFAISTGVGYLVGAQVAGRLADRVGRRRVAVVALLGAAAGYVAITATSIPVTAAIVMNALLVGLLAARIVAVQTMVTEQVPAARATMGALLGSVNAAAASGGAAIAGVAIDAGGFPLFGLAAAVLALVAAALLLLVRPKAADGAVITAAPALR